MSVAETHAAVIDEMHGFKCHNLATGELEECTCISKYLANRLEAAHMREIEKLNSVIQATVSRSDAEIDRLRREVAEFRKQIGNAAKMREALVGLIDGICFHCDMSEDCKGVPCEKMQKAKAALAAPPRQCDLGSAT